MPLIATSRISPVRPGTNHCVHSSTAPTSSAAYAAHSQAHCPSRAASSAQTKSSVSALYSTKWNASTTSTLVTPVRRAAPDPTAIATASASAAIRGHDRSRIERTAKRQQRERRSAPRRRRAPARKPAAR